MRSAGEVALASGHNDATVAAFLKIDIGRTAGAMARYGSLVTSADPDQAALGVAGVQRYAPLVHNALIAQLPARVIVVSVAGQRLQAFDHGRLVHASHGCIHAPSSVMAALFAWAPLGTPVVVFPGDGTSVKAQTAQQPAGL